MIVYLVLRSEVSFGSVSVPMRTYDRIPERTYAYLWRTYGVPMRTYEYL